MDSTRLLVMGDNHGDERSLARVVDATEGEKFDFVVHTGDITNTSKTDFRTGVEQLRSIEPHFEALAERGELVYVYGNRDEEDVETATSRHVSDGFELTPGHRLRPGETVEIDGLRFTADPDAAGPGDVLVTHHDVQRLLYNHGARAYFCGHSHESRQVGRSLNTGYLWKEREPPGSYFEVELGASGMSVEGRGLAESRVEVVCPEHAWYGTQFVPPNSGCLLCTAGPERQFRKMSVAAFTAAVGPPAEGQSLSVEAIVTQAKALFTDSDDYERQLTDYLHALVEDDVPPPKNPLQPVGDGTASLRFVTEQ